MGAFGGILFLVGLAVAFIGHRHMGEGPMESLHPRGHSATPFGLFIAGLIFMGIGVIVMVLSFAYGIDGAPISYGDFFPESSGK